MGGGYAFEKMEYSSMIGLSVPVLRLLKKGVRMPVPLAVDVGEEVDPERISADGVVFHGGTRIYGPQTLISAGTTLGSEAPCTLTDCLLGRGVELKGGFFRSSVFLDRANMGSGAQVREGCLIEEEANGNHTVGLKQTILFPFVTLGSLVNFCDCFLAGGTSRKDHSEVGSSYIHFNYTPNQDKATASLLGDVPRGVMLREAPIFLGGQGGLVGPARIGFGTAIAAGTIWRGDCPEGGRLLKGDARPPSSEPFHPGLYGDVGRRVTNNVLYIANLLALRQWYIHVRRPFFRDRGNGRGPLAGGLGNPGGGRRGTSGALPGPGGEDGSLPETGRAISDRDGPGGDPRPAERVAGILAPGGGSPDGRTGNRGGPG